MHELSNKLTKGYHVNAVKMRQQTELDLCQEKSPIDPSNNSYWRYFKPKINEKDQTVQR